MINQRFTMLMLALALLLTASAAQAQHDMGGGSTTGGAATRGTSGGGTSSRSTTVRRAPRKPLVRKPSAPARRGVTAEQYNAQGDSLFEAKNYDDALYACLKAVAIKPIAGAYYHIG